MISIKRDSIYIQASWAYHRIFFCAYWPMGWRRRLYSISRTQVLCGPMQLAIINEASGAEFQLALWRKRYGETLEERIRGAADFALISDWSSAEEKANARATLTRLNACP